jgi:hypothetical protein
MQIEWLDYEKLRTLYSHIQAVSKPLLWHSTPHENYLMNSTSVILLEMLSLITHEPLTINLSPEDNLNIPNFPHWRDICSQGLVTVREQIINYYEYFRIFYDTQKPFPRTYGWLSLLSVLNIHFSTHRRPLLPSGLLHEVLSTVLHAQSRFCGYNYLCSVMR